MSAHENRTEVFRSPIADPAAWDAASIGGKAGVTHALNAAELSAIAAILERTRNRPTYELTKSDFDVPELQRCFGSIWREILHGTGVVLVSGVTPEAFDPADFERIFWGFGLQFGTPAVQSAAKNRIGHVRLEKENPRNRGYMSDRELGFHSDAFEVIGLMCVQNAPSGGFTHIVSSLAVHNELLKHHPHVLDALYEGYPYATAERTVSSRPVTPYSVPVFSRVGETVSSMCVDTYMRMAADKLGVTFPPALDEALQRFFETCARRDLILEFLMDPGEILLLNNFTTVHSRTKFEDSETQRRHLLRLWLKVADGRPVVPALLARGTDYEELCQQNQRG
ncbi:TauD/TfdA family dioxygenase [Pendulispora brunnea]|uniref:TauD/TfdA family dioxygenase n=1 Tax=Pendulispora brunnea TaxID=2905690 RepID=A0ABZ2K9F6_9BACT